MKRDKPSHPGRGNDDDEEEESVLTRSLNASNRVTVPFTDDHIIDGDESKLLRRRVSTDDEDDCSVPLLNVVLPRPASCCVGFLRSLTVEPWLFLFTTSLFITVTAVRNLNIDKVCLFSFDHNATLCSNVTNATMENEIQVKASNVDLYSTLVDTFPSIVFSLFLGAFSDRRGRKLAMAIPVAGYVLSIGMYMAFAFYMDEVSPALLPLAALPKGMSGGVISAIVSALSYVSDRTSPERRTLRLALVEASFLAGQPIGNLVAGQLYPNSPVLVFAVALGLSLLALLLIITTITNDVIVKRPEDVGRSGSVFRDLFSVSSLQETFRTLFKLRENNGRFHVIMLLFMVVVALTPSIGQSTIMFLYTRLRFNWSITVYSYFSAISTVVSSVGLGFVTFFLVKTFKVPDKYLTPMGLLGAISGSLILSFSDTPLIVYLSCIPVPIAGLCLVSIRSQLSKLVPQDEQGKVFSVAGSCDALVPLISSLLYTRVYNATEAFFPEACFVMSTGIYVVPLLMSVILLWDSSRSRYVTITNGPILSEPDA